MKKNISRRSFVHQLSLATAAVMANPLDLYSCAPAAQKKLGVALVGLGGYSTGQLGPALKETKFCHLTGVVTGSPDKGARWAKEYGFDWERAVVQTVALAHRGAAQRRSASRRESKLVEWSRRASARRGLGGLVPDFLDGAGQLVHPGGFGLRPGGVQEEAEG